MKVEFRTNLGSRDCKEVNENHDLKLNHVECCVGSIHEVSDNAARDLIAMGIVSEVEAPPVPKGKRAGEEPAMQAESKK